MFQCFNVASIGPEISFRSFDVSHRRRWGGDTIILTPSSYSFFVFFVSTKNYDLYHLGLCFNVSMWPVLVLHFHFEVLMFPALASMSVTLPINQCTSSNSPPSLPTKCASCHSPHPIQKSLVVVGHCCVWQL